ncbi:MAG: C4-dicarboxylate TRAP transporter substrate-binding protein [Rhodospirillales bacterium]|nr:C4-dicarboxylate TRAP transporter substrate-binding protein [Rhodospirillales bacterium]
MSFTRIKLGSAVVLTGAVALSLGMSNPAQSVETIKLTAIDGYSTKSMWVREFAGFLIPAIDKKLAATGKYKIQWNQAWGGQIVKPRGVMGGMQKGLGDIGVVTTVFHADKVPMQLVAFATPFVTTDPLLVARTFDGLAEKFPEIKGAFSKFNQVYLTNGAVLDSYQIFSKKPITKLSDFNGLKVGSAGMNLRWLQGFGAAGVGGSLVTYYNKLKTGVLDAIMLWPESVAGRKIYEVAPYMLKADLGSVNSKTITMNVKSWNKLPGEVRKVIQESAIEYRDQVAKTALAKAAGSIAKIKANGGKIHVMSQENRVKWANTMPNVAKDWADSLEKKGLPGKAILASYMDTMRAANQPIIRQWDKE